ncbi:hypothetical protein QFC22_005289 [Naganishia vaughanmartiniae]|uniref:Uncharacterized protein n=1 Tax=Naganishia vaughanmartiniae TaxID=1424756 RepID=A0ACC2WWW3_9TREE|nr:hypothetical protein QFC22_005289 [Naganishia vaughanmartiniae]
MDSSQNYPLDPLTACSTAGRQPSPQSVQQTSANTGDGSFRRTASDTSGSVNYDNRTEEAQGYELVKQQYLREMLQLTHDTKRIQEEHALQLLQSRGAASAADRNLAPGVIYGTSDTFDANKRPFNDDEERISTAQLSAKRPLYSNLNNNHSEQNAIERNLALAHDPFSPSISVNGRTVGTGLVSENDGAYSIQGPDLTRNTMVTAWEATTWIPRRSSAAIENDGPAKGDADQEFTISKLTMPDGSQMAFKYFRTEARGAYVLHIQALAATKQEVGLPYRLALSFSKSRSNRERVGFTSSIARTRGFGQLIVNDGSGVQCAKVAWLAPRVQVGTGVRYYLDFSSALWKNNENEQTPT